MAGERIRLLRLLEYNYDSLETALADQQRWEVQGVRQFSARMTVRSTTLPLEILDEEPQLETDLAGTTAGTDNQEN